MNPIALMDLILLGSGVPVIGLASENIKLCKRANEIRNIYKKQEQFVADISHQLQTPIAILKGNIELAKKNPHSVSQSLDAMKETVDHMTALVNEFLEVARLNFSKNNLQSSFFNVAHLINGIVGDCLILAEAKNIRIEAKIMDAIIVGDYRKIKEVFLNIMSNALKYTDVGGCITVEVSEREGQAKIRVMDTGSGIAPEKLPHIFERFYRIPGAGEHGNGIGLNICREIVQMHGGTIDVESEVGKGSAFVIYLPLPNQAVLRAKSEAPTSAIL